MTLTGGFDLAVVLSASAVRGLAMAQLPEQLPTRSPVKLGPLAVPITPAVPLPDGSSVDVVALTAMLRKVGVTTIQAGDQALVRLRILYDGAALSSSALSHSICPIGGTITVDAPVAITATKDPQTGGPAAQPIIDLASASYSHAFTTSATEMVEGAMPGAATAVSDAITKQLQSLLPVVAGSLAFGPTIGYDPTGAGSLSPLTATRIEVRAISGGLALLMNLSAATKDLGDPAQKTTLGLPVDGSNLAVLMSPAAFHRYVFCPALAKQFKVPVASLPTSCGGGGSVGLLVPALNDVVDIDALSDSFEPGRIVVHGAFSATKDCVRAQGEFTGQITFPATGLTPNPFGIVSAPPPKMAPDGWECRLAFGLVTAFLGGAALGIANFFGGDVIGAAVSAFLAGSMKSLLGGVGLSAGGLDPKLFAGAALSHVTVSTDGLRIGGHLPVPVVSWKDVVPTAEVNGAVTTTSSKVVEQGKVHLAVPLHGDKDYDYTRTDVVETGSFELVSTGVLAPDAGTHWRLLLFDAAGGAQAFPLEGTGDWTATTATSVPDFAGPITKQRPVSIHYVVTPSLVTLTNGLPESGAYTVLLEGSSTLCGGAPQTATTSVGFRGVVLDIAGYEDDVNAAQKELWDLAHGWSEQLILEATPTRLQMIDRPAPDDFQRMFDAVSRIPEAAGIDTGRALSMLRSGHRNSMVDLELHATGRAQRALRAVDPDGRQALGQVELDRAAAAISTAQAKVEAAQIELAEVQAAVADLRIDLSERG